MIEPEESTPEESTPEESTMEADGIYQPPLNLPPEMRGWARENAQVVFKVKSAVTSARALIDEPRLWEMIAESYSPEWREAREVLRRTRAALDDPESKPLGAIGGVMQSEETSVVVKAYDEALVKFTVVNEVLHQEPNLYRLLAAVMEEQHRLEKIRALERNARDVTERGKPLSAMFKDCAERWMGKPVVGQPRQVSLPQMEN